MEKILLCFDNGDLFLITSQVVLHLAKTFGSEIVGITSYNAATHESYTKERRQYYDVFMRMPKKV